MNIFNKINLIIVFFYTLNNGTFAQKMSFGGGMGCQFQYTNISTDYTEINGIAWGIGGRLHCNLGKHFRIGGLGSTWKLSYSQKSYFNMGYGGITAEYVTNISSSRISFGAMFGGGKITNLQILTETPNGNVEAIYKTYPTNIFSPMITYEYFLTHSISLMATIDYLMGYRLGKNHMFNYPGIRIGILFNH